MSLHRNRTKKCSLFLQLAAVLSLAFATTTVDAEVLRWPLLCSTGTLQIQNTTSRSVRSWVQQLVGEKRADTLITIPARTKLKYPLQMGAEVTRVALLHLEAEGTLKAEMDCDEKKYPANSFEGGIQTFSSSDLKENKLWVQNLFKDENTLQIEFVNAHHETVETLSLKLKAFERKVFKVSALKPWTQMRLQADNRFTSFLFTAAGTKSADHITPQPSEVPSGAAYFLVGPRDAVGDAFTVKISDPDMIERARELVAHPEIEKMLFGEIQKGHQGFNRNFSKKEKSFWSWSVTNVTNFADLGSTACNGFPQLVEEDLDVWLQDPGRICFWNYRIKKELSPDEVAMPRASKQ